MKAHHITIDFVLYDIFRYFLSMIISFALDIKGYFTLRFFVGIVQRLKIGMRQCFVDRAALAWIKDQHAFQQTDGLFVAPTKQFRERSPLSFWQLWFSGVGRKEKEATLGG